MPAPAVALVATATATGSAEIDLSWNADATGATYTVVRGVLAAILDQVPDAWLLPEPELATPAAKRVAYVNYFMHRLDAASEFVEEATRARASLI